MENASKALIMAGSVLIAILVIGLLVLGYNNLSSLEQTREDSEANLKGEEYMQRFEQYYRTLYGSELLSLANLQEDYNNTSDVLYDGYDRIQITVTTDGIVNTSYFSAGTYSIERLSEDQAKIEAEISNYEKNNNKNIS